MAEQQQQQQQSQQQSVDPGAAREFLTGFGHPADALKGMPDPDVLKLHETVHGTLSKVAPEVVPFGSKWREHIAGEDAEAMKTLGRFQDPKALYKSYDELRSKMAKGELKASSPFPEKGTPEEQAAWRKEQGIPEKPGDYDLKLDGGLVIGEEDKPLVDAYLQFAHGTHTPGAAVKKTLEWFLGDYRERAEQSRAEAEKAAMQKVEDALRQDWGADFRGNMNAITGLLDANVSAEGDLKGRILKSIKLEPEFAKLWANVARQLNPVSTLVGGDPARIEQTVRDEIKQLEGWMKAGRGTREGDKYWKDEKAQARYRELLEAKDRMAGGQKVSG